MKKIIIGFIGDHNSGRKTAASILKKKGFYKASINAKVKEFTEYLKLDPNNPITLNNVRRRGCKVHKEYWLNLVLSSIPEDKNNVVFNDISIDEVEGGKIEVYQIYRPGVSTIELPDIKTIVNDGNIDDFTKKIEELYEELTKS